MQRITIEGQEIALNDIEKLKPSDPLFLAARCLKIQHSALFIALFLLDLDQDGVECLEIFLNDLKTCLGENEQAIESIIKIFSSSWM